MRNLLNPLALFLLVVFAPFAASAQSEDEKIISQTVDLARSYLGEDSALDGIKSIHLKGILVYGNGDSGTVDMVYKRPHFQQIASTMNGFRETSTLSRSEAWRKVERVDQPGAASLELYEIGDIYRMQAAVRDMMDFFKKPSTRNGKISYVGEEDLDGREVVVLKYHHGNGMWFQHSFDKATGRVVKTVNDAGMEYLRSGEQVVDGVRFPKKLITRFRTPVGEQVLEISYTSVEVNVDLPDSFFSMPLSM